MDATTTPAVELRHRRTLSRASRLVGLTSIALTVLVAAAWFQFLRPGSLGGPATYVIVSGTSMLPAMDSGDLVVAFEQGSYAVGDIVVYRVPAADPGAGTQIVHRIVGPPERGLGYLLRGDNREGVDYWRPADDEILGKVRLQLPRAGSALVFLRTTVGLAIVAALATVLFALALLPSTSRRDKPS